MLVELCAKNHVTCDKLFNCVNVICKILISFLNNETILWIQLKTGTKNQPISKETQINANSSHLIACTQFFLQLAIVHKIHKAQGLTLDYLAFDPTN
jgi:hypothetical protein